MSKKYLEHFLTPEEQVYLYNVSKSPNHYYKFYTIRQGRSGKRRTIEEPVAELMAIQKKLVPYFEQVDLYDAAMAVRGKSTMDNALVHAHAQHVLRVDISKCYPSVTARHVAEGFKHLLLHTENHKNDFSFYTQLHKVIPACMIQVGENGKRVLPTGAPTSPILCNVALSLIDSVCLDIAKGMNYKYTRYMDDLHFSTQEEKRDWTLLDGIRSLLEHEGFKVNNKKSKWMTNNNVDNIVITGVRVGKGTTIPREFKRMVRARITNQVREGKPLDAEINGCLAYIKSVSQDQYQKMIDYYEKRKINVSTEQNSPAA